MNATAQVPDDVVRLNLGDPTRHLSPHTVYFFFGQQQALDSRDTRSRLVHLTWL
ncbi:hypothetical protein [Arthrobacter sp. efr-133-R2A-120]|uniref:hypothetical protein n=1 Tax=Arthrobacter sp. efr-133-R2A-120 TaxID=3040277 RepID=UPI00254A324A|nr:hypothetical protein [Arthrobacter sp. efr-133-R2A-120]